jgi:site-specific DNA-methyltransferase (adenine-specific)
MKPYYETDLGKLYHGDCLKIMPQLEPVDFVYTDPPYNAKKGYGPGKDDLDRISYLQRMETTFELIQNLSNKFITHIPKKYFKEFIIFLPKGTLVVIERGAVGYLNVNRFKDQCDFLYVQGRPIKTSPTLWKNIRLKGEGYFFRENDFGHDGYTPQPIAIKAIQDMTIQGQLVLDPYGGTGTTGLASERFRRRWILIEYEEKYCEIAAKRIEAERKQLKLF